MKLDLSPRDSLIARMQAWAYEHVMYGNYPRATAIANEYLARFDSMVNNNPTDSQGYWASHYYAKFCATCEGEKL